MTERKTVISPEEIEAGFQIGGRNLELEVGHGTRPLTENDLREIAAAFQVMQKGEGGLVCHVQTLPDGSVVVEER
jgi:hypothetical protein